MLRNKPFWITLALVLLYLLAGYLAGPRLLQPRLQHWVADATGFTLAHGRIRFDPLTLSANIHDVRLLPGSGSSWPDVSLAAATVHLRFNFWKLQPAVSELKIRQPVAVLAAGAPRPYPWLRRWREWHQAVAGNPSWQLLDQARWQLSEGQLATGQAGSGPAVPGSLQDVNLRFSPVDEAGSRAFDLQVVHSGGSRMEAHGRVPAGLSGAQGAYELQMPDGVSASINTLEMKLPGGLQADGQFQLELMDGDLLRLLLSGSQLRAGRVSLCWSRQWFCSSLAPLEASLDAKGLVYGDSLYWQEVNADLQGFELQLDMSRKQVELTGPVAMSGARIAVQRRQHLALDTLAQPGSFDLSLATEGGWKSSARGVFDRAAEFAELEFTITSGMELNGLLRLRNLVGLQSGSNSSLLELQVANPEARVAQDFLGRVSAGRASASSLGLHLEASQSGSGTWLQGTIGLEQVSLEPAAPGDVPGQPDAEWLLALWQDPERNIRIPWQLQKLDLATAVTLRQFLESQVQRLLDESLERPFSLLGLLLAQQPDLQDEIRFTAGNAAVTSNSQRVIAGLAAILSQRPGLALRVPAAYDPLIDRTALQAEQIRTHIALAAAAEAEFQSGAAESDFSDPVVHSVMDEFARRRLPPQVLEAFFQQFGPADVDRGVIPEGDVEAYYASLFELLVEYADIPATALASLARYRAQAVTDGLVRRGVARERLQAVMPPQAAQSSLEGVPVAVELGLWTGEDAPKPRPSSGAESGE